jgi:anti-sigma-K factor RskA
MADMHDRLGAYVLDALDPDERREFERHLDSCSTCRSELSLLSGGVDALFESLAEPAPSGLRRRVLGGIGDTDSVPSLGDRRSSRARPWIVATAAAAVVAVVAGVGALLLRDEVSDTRDLNRILTAADAATVPLHGVEGRVVLSHDGAVLITHDLPEPADDRTYQLWVIGEGGPVPAGLFRPDEAGGSIAVLEEPVEPGVTIGVTEEPAGGSTAPTGEVVASAET